MRHFLGRRSTGWAIGVVLPLAMVLFDPIVFRGSGIGGGPPILGAAKPFGYTAIAAGISLLVFDLLNGRAKAFIAGGLAAACVYSVGLGLVLLPFSFMGVFISGIGLLGLSPFLCGAVLGRRAVDSYRRAPVLHRMVQAALGFGLFFIAGTAVQRGASAVWDRAISDIRSDKQELWNAGAARLGRWRVVLDVNQLIEARRSEPDIAGQQRLAAAYKRLTGVDMVLERD